MRTRLFVLPAVFLAAAFLPPAAAAPPGMVKIAGGTFEYGTDSADITGLVAQYTLPEREIVSSEAPQYKVTVAPFYIDKTEVTVTEYVQFVIRDTTWLPKGDSGKLSNGDYLLQWRSGAVPAATDSLPVTYVTWFAARAFCKKLSKRLPTEVEWEYAARGGLTGDVFPWGDSQPDPSRVNYGESKIGHVVKVGSYAPNGYGLFDMAGNGWEWTADQWTDPRTMPTKGPVLAEPWSKDRSQLIRERVVIRGGSYDGGAVNLRVRYRDSHPVGNAMPFVGFRCARNG